MAGMKKRPKHEVQSALGAWFAWSPLLAIFAVMAIDTTLSLETRDADYQVEQLAAQRRKIAAELDKYSAVEAGYNDVGRIAKLIQDLNMLLPDPSQIQVVVAHPDTPMPATAEHARDNAIEMAGNVPAGAIPTAPAVALPVPVAPVKAADTAIVPAGTPATAGSIVSSVEVAARPAAAAAPPVLDLPREQITDLDSPDAPEKDLLANL